MLPVKITGKGGSKIEKLIFPTGSFKGTYYSSELMLALKKGYTITILSGYIFKLGRPLAEYSSNFTNMKNEAAKTNNPALKTTAKLFINRLYGRFGAHYMLDQTSVIHKDEMSAFMDLFKINSTVELPDGHIIVSHSTQPNPNSSQPDFKVNKAYKNLYGSIFGKALNMALASAITSEARVLLYSMYEAVEAHGGTMCYSDTDSIFASFPSNMMPHGKQFGPFIWDSSTTKDVYRQAIFMAPKMYYLVDMNGKVTFKVKGVNTSTSNFTYEQLIYTLKEAGKLNFTQQTQFKRVQVVEQGVGIKVQEDLVKSYSLAATKRS